MSVYSRLGEWISRIRYKSPTPVPVESIVDDDIARPAIQLSKIPISGGQDIDLLGGDTLVIVGPNNVGKSQLLKDIYSILEGGPKGQVVVKSLTIAKSYSAQSLVQFIKKHFKMDSDGLGFYRVMGNNTLIDRVKSSEESAPLGGAIRIFVELVSTENRLIGSNPVESINIGTDNPTSPIHNYLLSDEIEREVTKKFEEAYGQSIIINRGPSPKVGFFVGIEPQRTVGRDRSSPEYLSELSKLPRLESQGDGVRAFVTILLSVLGTETSILLIDEPEAFLHPPQARLLGQIIASLDGKHRQIIVATHSTDFLQGLMDAAPQQLRLCKLSRESNGAKIAELPNADIQGFFVDPILRSTNALDALFSGQVVICESDYDAIFYREILRSISPSLSADTLFLHTGGKVGCRT